MQTFLPYPDFAQSAKVLDYRRLGKQRVEAKQLLLALFYGGSWANHPAARMWFRHELALAEYGSAMCHEWKSRGYQDNCLSFFTDFLGSNAGVSTIYPSWLGDIGFHRSHRSNLLRKLPEHYRQFGWTEPPTLPYVWPTPSLAHLE